MASNGTPKEISMTGRVLAVVLSLSSGVLLAGGQQSQFVNARFAAQPAGGSLAQTFRSLAAAQSGTAWIGYAVPIKDRNMTSCCWSNSDGTTHFSGTMTSGNVPCCGACRLEPAPAGSGQAVPRAPAAPATGPVKLEGSERLAVLFRIVDRQVERVRTFSEDCQLDAGGLPVHWLQDVQPAESVAFLSSLVDAEPARKSRVTNAALMAISQHAEPSAAGVIERLARSHAAASVRGEALFWLAQMAGE